MEGLSAAAATSLYDLEQPLQEHILLLCEHAIAVRLVCKSWRNIVDHSGPLFSLSRHPRDSAASLRSPKGHVASEGCLSWCRRNGDRLKAVELELDSSWWLLPFSPLRQLTNVTSLILSGSQGLRSGPETESMQAFSPLTRLQQLRIRSVPMFSWEALPTALRSLDIMECRRFDDLKPLAQLTNLTHLMLRGSDTYLDLEELAPLTGLESLFFDNVHILGISNLTGLTSFTFHSKYGMDDEEQLLELQSLLRLTNLYLELWHLKNPEFLQSSSLTALELWDIPRTGSIRDNLQGVPNLRQLSFRSCCKRNLRELTALRHLEVLDVKEADEILDFNTLQGLTQLKTLYIQRGEVEGPGVDLSALRKAGVEFKFDEFLR